MVEVGRALASQGAEHLGEPADGFALVAAAHEADEAGDGDDDDEDERDVRGRGAVELDDV